MPIQSLARTVRTVLMLGLLAALLPGAAPSALAQERLEERIGSAETPIFEDNLDAAKSRAVRGAQQNAIEQMLEKLLAAEWRELFRAELRRSILARGEKFIGSYRVQRLEPSLDRTRYFATIYAHVNRSRLRRELRRLGLPVRGDRIKPVLVLYSPQDPLLSVAVLRQEVLSALRKRMALLNFSVQGIKAAPEPMIQILENPYGEAAARGSWLRKQNVAAGLYVSFDPYVEAAGEEETRAHARATAYLYQAGSGAELGAFSVKTQQPFKDFNAEDSSTREAVLERMVRPLVAQLQPGGIRAFGSAGGQALPLKIRVLGLASVSDEESFAREFFQPDTPFGNFFLSRMDRRTVTYRGRFTGDRRQLEVELPGRQYGEFHIRHVFWFDDVLELDVEREENPSYTEVRLFPGYLRPAPVAEIIDRFLEDKPELELQDPVYMEREDNGWLARANSLPFNTTVYGFIDSRGDADFYIGDELKEGEVLIISWYRMGRTNLSPAVRMYNGEGKPVRFYHPKNWIRTKYRIPKGQHRLFIEVSDRFGEIKWDSGGYLNFHYLIQIERSGTD
ncbi:MAG: hypothetical protein O7G32_07275 [SAR324 cluster bacterium]|nr:hypothetical protein [SAR324 cluster bacterium]